MKLAVYFGIDTIPHVVHWDKPIMDFHHFFKYDDKYWQWTVHDSKPDYFGVKPVSGADQYLLYGKCDIGAIPMDIFGQRQPTPDFRTLFHIYAALKRNCECGAEKVHGKNTGHATWCPLWSKA